MDCTTRLLCPWDSPGKNTGVGCHALLLPNSEIEPLSPASPTLASSFFTTEPPGKLVLIFAAAAAAKSFQLCPTLCDPIEGSPLGSSVPGILRARTLEWVAISFSKVWKWKVKMKSVSRAQLLATPWTAAYQAPPFMGFSRQEYWSGLPLPSPRKGQTQFRNVIGPFIQKNASWQITHRIQEIFPYATKFGSDLWLYTASEGATLPWKKSFLFKNKKSGLS